VKLAFIDTEWTSLSLDQGEIWEVALILPEEDLDHRDLTYVWHIAPEHLGIADPTSLRISGYFDRFGKDAETVGVAHREEGTTMVSIQRQDVWAKRFVDLLADRMLVGLCPEGDAVRLDRLVRRWNQCPLWHYQTCDSEVLAAGLLGIQPPWDTEEISRAVGVEPDGFDKHTALGDALWAKAVYEAVMEWPR
jgi:hypothetical protein